MQVTVLGCAGTFPSAESGCSSYLVRHEGFTLVLDMGNGAVGGLDREANLFDVDAVLVSHHHADHCVDLAAYSYARRFHPSHPPRIPVYGPSGTRDRICRIFDRAPKDGLSEVYDFKTVRAGEIEIGPFRITLARTAHPIETYASRIEAAGRSLVYSADTARSRKVRDLAEDSDLFLCEATWLAGQPAPSGVHMYAAEAGEHAASANAKKLVLIHQMAYQDRLRTLEEAAVEYDGPLELAMPGTTYDL